MAKSTSAVTVLLAAHNEAPTIVDIIERCLKVCPPGSVVLVVDDGSTDETASLARAAGAQVLRLDENVGKGQAIRTGLCLARHPRLVLLDADGQD
ncbi:MAG TPA: glycosyl transferase, partial [Myxococcales bacterium]|nr:glycosyl transferase [Myxococcales bacterium]